MLKQKWLLLLAFIFAPVLAGCGVTVANEQYVAVGFINIENNQIELSADTTNATVQIEYAIVPSNATVKAVKFESSNPNIASVDDRGVVAAVSEGNTTIKVVSESNDKITATVNVRVVKEASTLATPRDLRMDGSSGVLSWEASAVREDSYFRPTYQLNILHFDSGEEETAKTAYTEYSKFDVDKEYGVTIQALGNGASYKNSLVPTEDSRYCFMRLSAPTDLSLVRLSDFGLEPESLITDEDESNGYFKVRFSINPMLLDRIAKTDEESETKGHVSDFYELSVVSSLNNIIDAPVNVLDPNIQKWKNYFKQAKVMLCPDDDKYYACFSVPQDMVEDTYRLAVSIKSKTLDYNRGVYDKIFCCGAGFSNSLRITQLSTPQNLVVRNIADGGEQLSWDAVQYAQGYVLEFKYQLPGANPEDEDRVVIKTYEVTQVEPNQFEVNFSDIESNQPGTILTKNEYKRRDIYIYTLARKGAVAGVYYVDSERSETPALIQLDEVENIEYTRNEQNNGGVLSWDKATANNVVQDCFYAVYIGNNDEANLGANDKLIYFSNESAVSDTGRFGIILADENDKWYDGYNYLKVVAWPTSGELVDSQSGFAKSEVAVSSRFLRLASIANFQYENTIVDTVNGVHQIPSLKWKWNYVSLPDQNDSLGEFGYEDFGVSFEVKVNQEIKGNKPYELEISQNEDGWYSLGVSNSVSNNEIFQAIEIAENDSLNTVEIRVVANNNSQRDSYLIASATKEILLKRYPKPQDMSVENGRLKFDLVRLGYTVNESGATEVSPIPINVAGYELVIVGGNISQASYVRTLDDVSDAIENFAEERELSEAEQFKLYIKALQTPENIDKTYKMDDDREVYYLDGVQSDGVFIVKLNTPVTAINDGKLIWSCETPNVLAGDNGVSVVYEIKYNDRVVTASDMYYEFTDRLEDDTSMWVRAVVRVGSKQYTEISTDGAPTIRYYILNSAWSKERLVRQCANVEGLRVDINDGVLSACWKSMDDVDSYRIIIKRTKDSEVTTVVDGDFVEGASLQNDIDPNTGEKYLRYKLSDIIGESAGSYTMTVYPNGNDNVLKCKSGQEVTFVQLSTPEVTIREGVIEWTPIAFLSGGNVILVNQYQMRIADVVGNNIKVLNFKDGQTSTDLAELDTNFVGKTIQVQVQAISELNSVLSSGYSTYYTINGTPKAIDAPNVKLLKWKKLDVSGFALNRIDQKLTWSYAPDIDTPNKYLAHITTPSGAVLTQELNSAELDLTQFSTAGAYVVKIKAKGYNSTGAGVFIDGDYSDAYGFERMAKSQAVSLTRESTPDENDDERLSAPILNWYEAIQSEWQIGKGVTQSYTLKVKYTDYNETVYEYEISSIDTKSEVTHDTEDGVYFIRLDAIEDILTAQESRSIAFSGGELEFTIITQPSIQTIDGIQILDSAGSKARGVVYDAPAVNADGEGNIVFTKINQNTAGSVVKVTFVPVCGGTLQEDGAIVKTFVDFIGMTKTISTTDVETSFREDYPTNYTGFVIKSQSIGNLGSCISSKEMTEMKIFIRLNPLEFGNYTNDNQWSVVQGRLRWKNVIGAKGYQFVLQSGDVQNNVLVERIETPNYEYNKLITEVDAGNYQLKSRLIGGDTSVSNSLLSAYFNSYLTSDFSELVDVVKIATPQHTRIENGEFDFGTRNGSGALSFGDYTSKYQISYTKNGDINYFDIPDTNPTLKFVAANILNADSDNVTTNLTVQAVGNTVIKVSEGTQTKPAFSSNETEDFTIIVPKTLDLAYVNGKLKWAQNEDLDERLQLQYTLNGEDAVLSRLEMKDLIFDDDAISYYFSQIEVVKGETLQNVKVRYSGSADKKIVNSRWSNTWSNIVKLPDIYQNEIDGLSTHLWVNNDGILTWAYGTNYDSLPADMKAITLTYTDNANRQKSISTTSENYVFTDLNDAAKNEIFAQVKVDNIERDKSYIDSDVFKQTFYKIADPKNVNAICDDCRIHWEAQTKDVEGVSVVPTQLVFKYNLNSAFQTHSVSINSSRGSIPMWAVGTYTDVKVSVLGVARRGETPVGLTLGSNLINLVYNGTDENIVFEYFAGGAGTPSDPYIIDGTNAQMVMALEKIYWLSDMYFTLGSNIILDTPDSNMSNIDRPNFDQYDKTKYPEINELEKLVFTGGFDGNGKTISNIFMKINAADKGFGWWNEIKSTICKDDYSTSSEVDFNNLDGVIKNLTLDVVSIDVTGLAGNTYSGVFACVNSGYLLDCVTKESPRIIGVTNTTIPVFDPTKKVNDTVYVGGLVGNVAMLEGNIGGIIYKCKNTISVKLSPTKNEQKNTYIGGIAGFCTAGLITRCVNGDDANTALQGTIVGGILGGSQDNTATDKTIISGCENKGSITSQIYKTNSGTIDHWDGYAGGIVGWLHKGFVVSCVNRGNISWVPDTETETYKIGGICGALTSGNVIYCVQMMNSLADSLSDSSAEIGLIAGMHDNSDGSTNGVIEYCAWIDQNNHNVVGDKNADNTPYANNYYLGSLNDGIISTIAMDAILNELLKFNNEIIRLSKTTLPNLEVEIVSI